LIGGFWLGLIAGTLALCALGAVIDRFVLRPLQERDATVTLLVTFGILLVIEDFARTVWGKDFRMLSAPEALSGVIPLGGDQFPVYRLAVIAAAIAVAVGLSLWLNRSRYGLYVRAASVDPVTTGMQGVDTNWLGALVVAIGAGLAGLAGVIAAPLTALSPNMGSYIQINCFVVVVTGGLGSFGGAFVAAMLIGQIHNFGVVFVPPAASMIPLLLMALVLAFRPGGLAGKPPA
jgi:branched-chain amino acid transport system permease protein